MWLVDYKDKHKNNLIPPTVFPACPDTWVFSGYVAFANFACPILVPSSERLDVFTENGKGLDKQTNTESGMRYQCEQAAGRANETETDESSLQKGVRSYQHIVALQCENDHDMKTFSENKTYLQNKYMANL